MILTQTLIMVHVNIITVTEYNIDQPSGFPTPQIPIENPLTVEGVNLGKETI